MIIIIKPAAIEDINQIFNYIKSDLSNPKAASNIKNDIFNGIERLQNHPKLGKKLRNTDYRYIIIKNILAFYKIENNKIIVIRVLDGRTDYLKILF